MPPKHLFVVRHGETRANEKGIEAGPLGYPLDKKGIKDVKFIAKTLADFKIKAAYSSPVYRAVQTAEIIAKPHKLKVKTLEELTEAKLKSKFVGQEERHHILTDPDAYLETNEQLLRRASNAIEIIKGQSTGNALVVSHGDVITALLEDVVERKTRSEKYYVIHPDPASLSIIALGQRPSLVLYNYRRKMFSEY
ncbi:MAG TPA: histidine phosphatase family protein [Nitrososphaera sp.]|nr:histidine phosphatase family protein [Nitrososphaera sp.]